MMTDSDSNDSTVDTTPQQQQQQQQQPVCHNHQTSDGSTQHHSTSCNTNTTNHNNAAVQQPPPPPPLVLAVFIGVGLLNNCPYVIMLANAKYINEGGVAIVYIVNIVPGLLVQITAPYWITHISYKIRLQYISSISMMMAFIIVAYYSSSNHHIGVHTKEVVIIIIGQLLGVAFISFQCGLGEASLLALAGKWDSTTTTTNDIPNSHDNTSQSEKHNHNSGSKHDYLSAFAMGTGMAGPIGFLWNIAFTEWIGLSVSTSLYIAAIVLSLSYGVLCTLLIYWSHPLLLLDTTTTPLVTTSNNRRRRRDQYSAIETESDEGDNNNSDGDGDINLTRSSEIIIFDNHRHNNSTTTTTTTTTTLMTDTYQPPPPSSSLVVAVTETEIDNDEDVLLVSRDGLMMRREYLNDTNLNNNNNNNPPSSSLLLLPTSLSDMSIYERFQLLFNMCWIYMIPLFIVYVAEYACQAGAWTSIGFPNVTDPISRVQFFERSNWLYQAGVFVSRSTGSLFSIPIIGLWIIPLLQVLNLIIFTITASTGIQHPKSIFYHESILLPLSFVTGLFGGAVYVHGYNRIVHDVPVQYTEFAVASTSVAVSFGVLVADILGLYIQSCLYQSNDIDGAVVQCPFSQNNSTTSLNNDRF